MKKKTHACIVIVVPLTQMFEISLIIELSMKDDLFFKSMSCRSTKYKEVSFPGITWSEPCENVQETNFKQLFCTTEPHITDSVIAQD